MAGRDMSALKSFKSPVVRIPVLYLLVGTAWILFSDRVVDWFNVSRDALINLSIVKGCLFVLTTALMLYLLIRKCFAEKEEARHALSESEERYRSFFDHSRDAKIVFSPSKGLFESANAAALELFGAQKFEALATQTPWTLSPLLQPDGCTSIDKAKERLETTLQNGVNLFEWRHKTLSDKEFDAEVLLSTITIRDEQYILATIRDITLHKEVNKQLVLCEQRFQDVVLASDDWVWEIDHTLHYTYASRSVEQILGYTVEEILGLTPFDLMPPEEAKRVYEEFKERADRAVPLKNLPNICLHKDGSIRHLLTSGMPIMDSSGRLWGYRGLDRDATRQKLAEENIKRNDAHLQGQLRITQFDEAKSVQEFLDFALNEALTLTESKLGYIYYYDETTSTFTLNTWSKEVMDVCTITEKQTTYELNKTGIWGEAVRQRRPIVINDFPAPHPLKKGYPDGHAPLTRFMTIPVFTGDRIVAVVGVANKETDYDDTDIRQLTLMMDMVWKTTERKIAQQELINKDATITEQNSELIKNSRFIENLVMQSSTPIFVIDKNHRILYWSQALANLTGLSSEQMKGTDRQWQAFYPDPRPTMADLVLDHAEQKVPEFYEHHYQSKLIEGAVNSAGWFQFPTIGRRYLIFHAAPIYDSEGTVVASIESFEDHTETKQIEDRLNEQYRFLQQVLDTLPNPVFYKNRHGAYIGCNRAFEEFFGISRQELMGKHITDINPPETTQLQTQHDQECMKEDCVQTYESSLIHCNGSVRRVITTKAPLHLNSGKVNGLVGSFTDITERKRTEIALQESEEKFRSISNSAQDAIIMIDNSGQVTFWNAAAEQIFGYETNEVMGRNFHEIITPKHLLETHKSAFATFRGCGLGAAVGKTLELPAVRKDGREIPIELSLSAVKLGGEWCATGLARDISDRKKAEEAIKASQAALEAKHAEMSLLFTWVEAAKREWEQTLDSINDIIILADPEHHIRRCNRALVDITSKEFVQLAMQDWREVLAESGFSFVSSDGRSGELLHEGTGHQFDLNTYEIHEDNGSLHGLVITLNDVTAIKKVSSELEKAHGELKATQSQVVQQEKLASIGQMAAGVAHEINNPVAFISCNVNMMGKYLDKLSAFRSALAEQMTSFPDSVRQEIEAVQRRLKIDYILQDSANLVKETQEGTERVRKIVQDLKSFSRVDQGDEEFTDIAQCLDSTINIAWHEIKYIAKLNKEYGETPKVRCYPQQINQVFMNLLVNAAHAIIENGEITVRTWHDADNVYIAVCDTGSGIPEEIQPHIFEPFFTTKENGKGTGLGLSISSNIIKKHGGDITLVSEPGKGTVFTVRLPICGI